MQRTLGLCRRLGYGDHKLCVVVNRYQSADVLPLKDAEELLKWPIFWHLPNDYRLSSAALTKGVPVAVEDPGSKLARSYRDLAVKLGGAAAAKAAEARSSDRRGASVIKSWFGIERRLGNVT
jgi:Flp pilus assembly CpaE family ATPase